MIENRGAVSLIPLTPGQTVQLPGTGLEVRWEGDEPLVVYRTAGGFWNLAPAIRPGQALMLARLAKGPHLSWYPILPLARRSTYRAGHAEPHEPAGSPTFQIARVTIRVATIHIHPST